MRLYDSWFLKRMKEYLKKSKGSGRHGHFSICVQFGCQIVNLLATFLVHEALEKSLIYDFLEHQKFPRKIQGFVYKGKKYFLPSWVAIKKYILLFMCLGNLCYYIAFKVNLAITTNRFIIQKRYLFIWFLYSEWEAKKRHFGTQATSSVDRYYILLQQTNERRLKG